MTIALIIVGHGGAGARPGNAINCRRPFVNKKKDGTRGCIVKRGGVDEPSIRPCVLRT